MTSMIETAQLHAPSINDAIGAFWTAYERAPSPEEVTRIATFLNDVPVIGPKQTLRLVLSIFDRQFLGTSVAIRFGREDLVQVMVEGVQLIVDRMDHAVSGGIIRDQFYEPHLTAFMEQNVKPGMTVVDIGANIGFFSMFLASLVGQTGRVISFEPNTENCRLLLLSKEANGFDNIDLNAIALSNKRGVVFFTPAVGSNGSILPNEHDTLLDPNCIVVPCDRLDNVIDRKVDLIKADVEGAEYLALTGGEVTIRSSRPIICTEFSMEMLGRISGVNGKDFLYWLQKFGYRIEMLGKTSAGHRHVTDIDQFIVEWGDPYRIEDLAFIPVERGGAEV